METKFTEFDKHHFNTILAHIDDKEKETLTETIVGGRQTNQKELLEIVKVHFLNKKPKQAICMVTKIPLNFDQKNIVICPKCWNFAVKDSLEKWLEEESVCPICKTTLQIDDFPLVLIKNK